RHTNSCSWICPRPALLTFPTRRSSDLALMDEREQLRALHKRYAGNDRVGLPDGSIWETYARGVAQGGKSALADFNKAVEAERGRDRKSTRLNSSHVKISYAVFCLKKKA